MIEKNALRKMTHDLSNKLMILEGYITLMQLDSKHISPDTIQKLADTLNSATGILTHFKSSEEYKLFSADGKKE
jgi:sensor histidine kinase regulating citrate/malate metabolism